MATVDTTLGRPCPTLVRTGPVSALVVDGSLRDVRLGDATALDGVYVAVRDQNWETIAGVIEGYEARIGDDAFTVTYVSHHRNAQVDFSWKGRIEGRDGTITFSMDGTADRPFLGNRIGFCLVHPQTLQGQPVVARMTQGVVESAFPEEIAPHQPFLEMVGMEYTVADGARLAIRFDGDLFETEDQRNWTDASYKTYCTPLRLPFPRRFEPGEPVRQAVTLGGESARGGRAAARPRPPAAVDLAIGSQNGGRLPGLGFGVPSQGGPLADAELDLVRALHPAHLRVEVHLGQDWLPHLDEAVSQAEAVGATLDVEAVSGGAGDELGEVIAELAGIKPPLLGRLFVFDAATSTTSDELAARLRGLLDDWSMPVALGGGSRADYAELNRASLPLDVLDLLTYSINPQVHAFDNASVLDTLRAQPATLAGAQRIAGARPVVVGPMTLRPRFNPVATGPLRDVPPDDLPPQVDPRQADALAAAWTVGSIAALRSAAALTYFEAAGWRGLFSRADPGLAHPRFPAEAGAIFPVYRVFEALAPVAGGALLPVETSDERRVAALAVRGDDGFVALIANLTDEELTVRPDVASTPALSAQLLDSGSGTDPVRLMLPGHGTAVLRDASRPAPARQ